MNKGIPPVVVDTSVWVEYFNRPGSSDHRHLRALIVERAAVLTDVVMAEILQGARTEEQFQELADMLQGLPRLEATVRTGLLAGDIAYRLKKAGRTIPMTDVLIAAAAMEYGLEVFSRDEHFRRVPGLRLYRPEGAA